MGQMPGKTRLRDLPPAQQAAILCITPKFQIFAAHRCGFPGTQFSETATVEYLRRSCGIDSRRTLNTDTKARARFHALWADYDAWAGHSAAPR